MRACALEGCIDASQRPLTGLAEFGPAGQAELFLQVAKLRLVLLGDAAGKLGTARQQVDLDAATILVARATFHQAQPITVKFGGKSSDQRA